MTEHIAGLLGSGEHRGKVVKLEELPDNPTAVIIRLNVCKLCSIDPVQGCFFADFVVHMWWFEPSLVEKNQKDEKVVELSCEDAQKDGQVAIPHILFDTALSMESVEDATLVVRDFFKPGVVHWEQRVRGTFVESFELHHFPYDVQLLTVPIRINSKRDDVLKRRTVLGHAEDKGVYGAVGLKSSATLSEWIIHPISAVAGLDDRGKKPQYTIHIPLHRRHEYFTQNVISIAFAISTLGFSAFGVPSEELADRSSITLTLLLTMVAFKFVISDSLPKVPYTTCLDKYFISCIGLLVVTMVQNAAIAKMDEVDREEMDLIFLKISGGIWLGGNIAFFLMIRLFISRVTAKLGPPKNECEGANPFVQAQYVNFLPRICLTRRAQAKDEISSPLTHECRAPEIVHATE